MLLSALPFGVVGILFQYDFPVPSHPTVLLLSFIATVLGSYCLVVHAIFKLLIRRSIEKHNSLNKKQKLLAREKHWLFPLAILQVVLFPLQRLVKSWKQDPHTLQGGACDADRWNTGSLAFTAAVIILLALFAAYEASGQSKFVAVTFTAEQEVVANPEKGLVATYIITYNKELFNDNTSFQAKPGFTIRPKGGDYYARNAGWQLGDDMIEFANKHQLHILNSGGRKIEIWTFKNYTEEEWVEIVDAVNKIIGKAFAIKQFIPN